MTKPTFDAEMITIVEEALEMEVTNEVAVALIGHGYTSWKLFRQMQLSEVFELMKSDGKGGMMEMILMVCTYSYQLPMTVETRDIINSLTIIFLT